MDIELQLENGVLNNGLQFNLISWNCLIAFGFGLFLYSEMKERELDIKLFELEQKIKEELKDE